MNKPGKYALLGLSALILAYSIFRVSYWGLTKSGSCTICHEMKPYYTAWTESPHSNVECQRCHEPRGAFGKLENLTLHGLRAIWNHITGEYSSMTPSGTYDNNCITCHAGKFRKYPKAPPMTTSPSDHLQYVREEVPCSKCHRDTGHTTGIAAKKAFEEMGAISAHER